MKLGYKHILLLGFSAILASCANDVEVPAAEEKVNVTLSVRAQGSAASINADNVDFEDKVESITLAGSPLQGSISGSTANFTINSYFGKRDMFFAANLDATDMNEIGKVTEDIDALLTLFNTTKLDGAKYYRQTPSDKKALVMVATLKDVTVTGNVLSTSSVSLKRVFAKLTYNINVPSGYTVTNVTIANIPQKFQLGIAIDGYDLKHAAEPLVYPYMSFNYGTATSGVVYLPEHKVSQPVFYDPDLNGMTHLVIAYTDASSNAHTVQFRIADGTPYSYNFGQIVRNVEYQANINITGPTDGVLN